MEIICIDKRTFDVLVVRFSMIEKKVTGICNPAKDAGLKKWMDNQEVCGILRISKRTLQVYREKGLLPFTRGQEQVLLQAGRCAKHVGIKLSPTKKKAMSYDLIDRKDQRIDTIFKGLENMERMIDAIRTAPRPAFHSDYFLTDEELSKLLKVSRRTLQEYRTLGVIPYYLVQGKALYKESDIQKVLDDAYKRCREEQRWV